MTHAKTVTFGGIEVGRGIAAALVVFHHSGSIVTQPRFFGSEGFGGHLANFNVGVDFFFVLSGFIIAWVHWGDIGHRGRLTRYAIRRFVRIYPPYWGVVVPLIILYQLFPTAGISSQRDAINIAFSLALMPYPLDPVLGVAWTLVHEILFYTLFGFVILVGRRAIWLLPVWGVSIIVAQFALPLDFPWSFFLSPFNIEFLLGIAAALWLRHHTIAWPRFLLLGGSVVFVASMLFGMHIQDNPFLGRLVFGISAMTAILGMVEWERSNYMKMPELLRFFGAASYAMYLVHPVAISFGIHVVSRVLPKTISIEIVIFILAVIGIGAGCLYHRWFELPVTRLMRRNLERLYARANAPSAVEL